MRLGQTSIMLSASKFLSSGLGFLATVYFARELGGSVLGQYALVLTVITWLGIFGEVGLSKAVVKRISEGWNQPIFFGAAIIIFGILFALTTTGVLIAGPWVNGYVGADVTIFVVILIGLGLWSSLYNAVLQGNHLVHISAVISAVERTIRTIAQVMFVVVGLGLTGMLLGYAISGFVSGVIGLLYINIRPMVPGREHIQSLFEFAKYAWLGNVSNRAYNSVDIAVLGLFVTSELIGIYSVAWSIAMFLSIFGQSLEGTFFPEMSKNAGQSGSGTVRKLTEDALRYSGLVTIPGFVGGLIVGDRLLLIYGSSFQKGTIILVILIGAALLYAYLRQLRNTLNAIDRPDLAFRVNAVFIGVNMILNLVLIWQFSWVGAAVATLVSAGVGLVMAYYHIRSEVRISIPLRSIGRQCIAATVMGSLVFGLRQVIEPYWHSQPNIVFVVFLVSIGAVVYFGVLAAIWPDFRLTVTNNLSIKKFPG